MHTLDVTNEEKDLGIIVDNKLSFKAHINNSANKANRILGMIRRTFTHLVKDILTFPLLEDATLTLMDIDEERLDYITRACQRIVTDGLTAAPAFPDLNGDGRPDMTFLYVKTTVLT